MATIDNLVDEIHAEHETRPILDEPIREVEERLLPRPLRPQWVFADLDRRVPHPVDFQAYEPWVQMLADAKDEFEVDGTAAVFSTWRVEREDLLDVGNVEIVEGIHARAGRPAGTGLSDDRRQGCTTSGGPPGGRGVPPANQVSPGEG